MKKIFCVLFVAIAACLMMIETAAASSGQSKVTDIRIIRAKQPKPVTHRSALPEISAAYDAEASNVEVEFNECFGAVVIHILNPMFQVVARYECNTDTESLAFIPFNADEAGMYSIRILGEDLEAEGSFDSGN